MIRPLASTSESSHRRAGGRHNHLVGRLLLFSFPQLSLREFGTEDREGGRGRTYLRGEEGGYLPERCHAPQEGQTPLHHAAKNGHAAVVEQLLAVGAAADAKDKVRGGGGMGEGWVTEHSSACPLDFLALSSHKSL